MQSFLCTFTFQVGESQAISELFLCLWQARDRQDVLHSATVVICEETRLAYHSGMPLA